VESGKLTVRLPKESLEFAKQYAAAHRVTMTELVDRYFRALQGVAGPIHPDVERISGLVPPDVDVQAEYQEHFRAE
jgi:hypothetical protein